MDFYLRISDSMRNLGMWTRTKRRNCFPSLRKVCRKYDSKRSLYLNVLLSIDKPMVTRPYYDDDDDDENADYVQATYMSSSEEEDIVLLRK